MSQSSAAPAPTPETAGQPEAPVQVAPAVAPQASGSDLACQVAGSRAFADTWGAPRSGGRFHEGVDVISPSGTPLVAMESGRVEYTSNGRRGQQIHPGGGQPINPYPIACAACG